MKNELMLSISINLKVNRYEWSNMYEILYNIHTEISLNFPLNSDKNSIKRTLYFTRFT